jgi:putative sterol carrier protein
MRVNALSTRDELHIALEKMVSKIELPQNKDRFSNYNKTLQLTFTDNDNLDCYIVFNDGSTTIIDGLEENAELKIITTTAVIMAIIDGSQSPTLAFVSGKVKAKGPMSDLMKLQALMK